MVNNRINIVCGATSGFGSAIAKKLLSEGKNVLAIARNEEKLNDLRNNAPEQVQTVAGSVYEVDTLQQIIKDTANNFIEGVVVNAGGPPATSAQETTMQQWDDAYNSVLRWKVDFINRLLPKLKEQQYGRVVCVESISIKQPFRNLTLSNAFRMAMAGFVKTLTDEVAKDGITINIMAPGFHDTAAAERVFVKMSQTQNIAIADARKQIEKDIPTGNIGRTDDFASLACWLLSEESRYLTGQTISVDGGLVRGSFG